MSDRRRYPRIDLQLPLRYRMLTKLGDAAPEGLSGSRTKNLGVGGLCVGSDTPLPEGAMLELELSLPSDKGEMPVRMAGRVAWCRAGGSSCEVGVELVSVSEPHLRRLISYVAQSYADRYRLEDDQRKALTDLLQKLMAATARNVPPKKDTAL